MEWILASASPRRKELLREIVAEFVVIPAKGEECVEDGLPPERVVQLLAREKAHEVAKLPVAKGKAVLGADTVVAFGGKILGKPKDEQEAKEMLSSLSGNVHAVYTGVCVITPDGTEITDVDCTEVEFFALSEAFIDGYVQTGSPMDKAGAYGIQDGGLVKEIRGSYTNVVGLPVELLKTIVDGFKEKI
jgi:septum formation protein